MQSSIIILLLLATRANADNYEVILERLAAVENKAQACEATIAEMKGKLEHQDLRIVELEKESVIKEATITQLSANDNSHSAKRFVLDNGENVAFQAVVSQPHVDHIGVHQHLVFDKVLLNLGGAYHNQHGTFIAPLPGLYVFSTSVMSYHTNNHVEIQASLVKNGTILARAYAHGDNGRHDQGSVTVTVRLAAGEEVWVENYPIADASTWGDGFDTFTGILLFPE